MTDAVGSTRQAWADVAKGVSISFVVYHHAVAWFIQKDLIDVPALFHIYNAGQFFRMPLFFMASGIFACSTIVGSESKFWGRIRNLMYLFILWSTVRYILEGALSISGKANFNPLDAVFFLSHPMPNLWFIYALAIFTVIARVTRRVPSEWIILFAVAANLTIHMSSYIPPAFDTGNSLVNRVLTYYVFFALGATRPDVWREISDRANWKMLTLSVSLFIALYVFEYFGAGDSIRATIFLTQFVSIVAAVIICTKIQSTVFGREMASVGKKSLPIYLMHAYTLEVGGRLYLALGLDAPDIAIIVLTAASVVMSIIAYEVAMRLRLTFLFELPRNAKPALISTQ